VLPYDDAVSTAVMQTSFVATLRALVDVLSTALTPLTDPAGLDVEVSEVVLVGPGDPLPDGTGLLLMCLDRTDLLQRLTGSQVAGVVIKPNPTDDVAWKKSPLPVIAADEGLAWQHLQQLLTTAAASAGASSSTGRAALGDLFALANSVAAMVGGAVAIEDPQRRVIAYSSLPDQAIDETRRQGILGRQVPHEQGDDELYRDVQRSNGVLRVKGKGSVLPRLAIAVRAGAELLGSLWVVESTPLGPDAEQALGDAGRLAALHLLRARASTDVERRARSELLRGLLDGRTSPEVAAVRLGLDVAARVAVLGFSLPVVTAADYVDSDAAADLVQLQCSAIRPRSSVLVQFGTVYALVPVEDDLPRARLVQLAQTVVARARAALRIELRGAIGSTVNGLNEVTRSRKDVDALLRLIAQPGSPEVAAVEALKPQVVLLDLHAHMAVSPDLRLPAVDKMLAHDRDHGTPYAESVLAYLATGCDIPAAADSVNIHANTFRYRLRRVKELFDLDLDLPDVRLVTWLQLRVHS
jgi:hypothetical protein